MTFYLIGTGLDLNSIAADALEVIKKCDSVYVENYTVNFPYPLEELAKSYGVKIIPLERKAVEDESVLTSAKDSHVALLVYGDALSATTHMQLLLACKEKDIHYKIFHNASIMTAIATTGLQPYKFGKTASMPDWKEHTNKPTSFTDYIKQNTSIGAHSLILTDIGLELSNALMQLEESFTGLSQEDSQKNLQNMRSEASPILRKAHQYYQKNLLSFQMLVLLTKKYFLIHQNT